MQTCNLALKKEITLKLYNSLSKNKEELKFLIIKLKCLLVHSVYDNPHIGNFRAFVFDVKKITKFFEL